MNRKTNWVIIVTVLLFPAKAISQNMDVWEPNLTSLSEKVVLSDTAQYPEENILPWNAPCTDCKEDLTKRTLSERYFSRGNEFFVQKSVGSLHYVDDLGRMITIDPRLRQVAPGEYEAAQQPTPTFIVSEYGSGVVLPDGQKFLLNHNLVLYEYKSGVKTEIANANWSTHTKGDDGVRVVDIFPDIDLLIVVNQGEIESDFVIKKELPYGTLVIEDSPIIPEGWSLSSNENGNYFLQKVGEVVGIEIFRPIIFDKSGVRSSYITDYEIEEEKFRIYIDSTYLHDPSRVYPVVVDPLVSSTATYAAGSMEFMYNGSFCAGPNTDCSYSLSVPLPLNSTLTGATLTAEYRTVAGSCAFVCWMSDAGFYVSGPCGDSPGGGFWWSCISPAGDAIGTCTGAGINIFNTVSCLTPVCSGNVIFDIYNSYCFCSANGTDCTGTLPCQRMNNNTWVITLTGRNLETLGDAVDGNGNQTLNADCCELVVLDPGEGSGVPPYTYLWGGFGGGGSTASDTTVFSCADGTWTYTCLVTDACNVTRTATFDLVVTGCGVLPISLIEFGASWNGQNVDVIWKTESEVENSHYSLYRSMDGINMTHLVDIPGGGSSSTPKSYIYKDYDPLIGTNYYHLFATDYSGQRSDCGIVSAIVNEEVAMQIVPNPASQTINVYTNTSSGYIVIKDVVGKIVLPIEEISYEKEVDVSQLAQGVYFVYLVNENHKTLRRLVVE